MSANIFQARIVITVEMSYLFCQLRLAKGIQPVGKEVSLFTKSNPRLKKVVREGVQASGYPREQAGGP